MDALLSLVADDLESSEDRFPRPYDLARYIDPRRIQTPALEIVDQVLVDAIEGRHRRVIITMAPQEGKSERISRTFPAWSLQRNPDLRIASVSAVDALARRWGRQVRNDLQAFPEVGLRIRQDTQAANEWRIDGRDGGMITTSIGGIITGRPVDIMVIDDPLADMKQADSETIRGNIIEWWQGAGSTRMPEDGIVVVVQTRWHEKDLAGWLVSGENENRDAWKLINIPAQAEHDPEKGAECTCGAPGPCLGSDILGRQPGEYMLSARGRTTAGWETRKREAGSRVWAALYQGRPAPAEGGVIKRAWWRYYTLPRAMERADGSMYAIGAPQVIMSVDCTFKDSDGTDYVVIGIWGRRGPKAWLLDVLRERMDFPTTSDAIRQMAAKWPQATLKLIEDKANGPAVIATLSKEIPGILAYSPIDSKLARAYSITPFVEAGDVELPSAALAPWVGRFVEECAGFPNGAHDDQVDMMTQALIRLLLLGAGGAGFMSELAAEQRTAPTNSATDMDDAPVETQGFVNWSTEGGRPLDVGGR